MSERKVFCKKLNRELPGLLNKPFDGELGEEIYNNISSDAWKMWQDDMMIKVINEYRLDMINPDHFNTLLEQMKAFFNLETKETLAEVENPERGQS